jgi:hypothetical protein
MAIGAALFMIILLEYLNYEMHRDLMERILWYLDYLAFEEDDDEPVGDDDEQDGPLFDPQVIDEETR